MGVVSGREKRMEHPNPTVSLVLGSGGARGLAHIGGIDWLTGNGYAVRPLARSPPGALIGRGYAGGKGALVSTRLTCRS